ncbi:MAG: membrane protein insertase YidC [Flavobacteriales bacterium]|nr:membrane protein insertase YidC [Flavobacteriales bacterium]
MKFDKNTVIGFTLMVVLLIGFAWYQNGELKKQAEAEQARLDSLAKVEASQPKPAEQPQVTSENTATMAAAPNDSLSAVAVSDALNQKYGILSSAVQGEGRDVVIENNRIKVTLNTKGGMVKMAELTDGYKTYHTKENIKLWSDSLSAMKLLFNLYGKGSFKSDEFVFTPSTDYADAKGSAQSVSMKLLSADPSKYLELIYSLTPDSYQVGLKINVVGMGDDLELGSKPMNLEWFAAGLSNEKGISAERARCSIYYREMEEDRDYLSETAGDEYVSEKKVNWMSFKQDYFSAAIVSQQGFNAGSLLQVNIPQDSSRTKFYFANLGIPMNGGASTSGDLTFYFGPNDYRELKMVNAEEFDRIIDYGWSIIGTVNRWCIRPLFWFFSSFIGSWGLIILLVTLVIKTVLFPITWKNFMSSAKMRVLKPEIDEINKKYEGKDAVQKQQATMALYRQTGVNPFAGCIPVLLQMPILYAMFRFFPAEIVLRGKSFLWADDLAAYDSIFSWSQNIPILSSIYGNHISGFTILMAASTFLYSQMSMGAQPQMAQQPGMPNMKVMMNLFTVMMLFFFNNQPSGLALYYFIANMVSIGQMWAIKKYFIDEDAIRAKIEENKKKPKTKSSFMQRLEEAQKLQQQRSGKK